MEPFYGGQVWAFLMELENLHDVLNGAEGMKMIV
jgi:hypothetical protein